MVTSTVLRDARKHRYIYRYLVKSLPSSELGVEEFALAPAPVPDSVISPKQWRAFFTWEDRDDAVVWACIDTLTEPPPDWDSLDVYPSPFGLAPGGSKEFRLISSFAPRAGSFYAQGFAGPPDANAYDDEDDPTLFRVGVTGKALVPGRSQGR